MTVLALGGGTNMVGRRRGRLYETAAVVARDTLTGGSLEDARDMAELAVHILMRPFKRPGGGEMIKSGAGGRLRARLPRPQGDKLEAHHEKQRDYAFTAGEAGVLLH
jgi:hypothetical protein